MINNYVVNCIIQARMSSSRLPGKVLLPLAGKPVLQHIIERLRRSKYIDEVIVACTTNEADNAIVELCDSLECKYYRGSEENVLERVLDASRTYKSDIVVDITADCPCVDWDLIDNMIETLCNEQESCDYVSNVIKRTMPRGLDAQVFWHSVLERVNKEVDNSVDIQHVTSWIYKNPKSNKRYTRANIKTNDINLNHLRLTLDTKEDYKLLQFVFSAFDDNDFTLREIHNLYNFYEEMFEINQHIPQKSYYKELMDAYAEKV